jgi:hypothetical protein
MLPFWSFAFAFRVCGDNKAPKILGAFGVFSSHSIICVVDELLRQVDVVVKMDDRTFWGLTDWRGLLGWQGEYAFRDDSRGFAAVFG